MTALTDDVTVAPPPAPIHASVADRLAPDISVVIATCNRPHTLVDAIGSALGQAGANVEVIVVDDSPGRTAEAAVDELAEHRVRYIANPQPSHGRPAAVRNYGVSMARAGLIHFLDDDDLVPAGHYAAARAAFAARPGIGAVFGTIEPFGEDGDEIATQTVYFAQARRRATRCANLGHRWSFTAAMLFGPTLLVCSAGMVRRELVDTLGGFDVSLPLVEDVDFYMRAMRQGGVQFLDRPALKYRVGPSLMRQPRSDQLILESYRRLHARYRGQHGAVEFTGLKILAKGLALA